MTTTTEALWQLSRRQVEYFIGLCLNGIHPRSLACRRFFRHPASQSIPAFGDEDSFCGMCGQRYGSTRTAELLLYSSTLQVRADYGRFPSKCFPSASCCLTLSRRTPYHGWASCRRSSVGERGSHNP